MTDKQKLKSIEKKMMRIQDQKHITIDLKEASRFFHDIERYYKLRQEHFFLQFKIEHCQTCGKKLKP